MFRDCPTACCNYRVVLPDGNEASAAEWLVQRVYDGNPVGYGVGLCPPAVLEQRFGVTHEEAAVRQHFTRLITQPERLNLTRVEVIQDVIGPLKNGSVGEIESRRWRIERP